MQDNGVIAEGSAHLFRTPRRIPALSTVGVHITALASSNRPSSPLKQSCLPETPDIQSPPSPELVCSPIDATLTNVFGSILQSSESLAKYSCAICNEAFAPDATIYPEPIPSHDAPRYLCRPCFTLNGGTKGSCASCNELVLTLKSEGSYVEHAGQLWHKSCFICRGC